MNLCFKFSGKVWFKLFRWIKFLIVQINLNSPISSLHQILSISLRSHDWFSECQNQNNCLLIVSLQFLCKEFLSVILLDIFNNSFQREIIFPTLYTVNIFEHQNWICDYYFLCSFRYSFYFYSTPHKFFLSNQ